MKKIEKSVIVQNGENLAAILQSWPEAQVETLLGSPGQDSWRVKFVIETEEKEPEKEPEKQEDTLVLSARKKTSKRKVPTSQGKDHVHEWVKVRKPSRGWRYRCRICGVRTRTIPEGDGDLRKGGPPIT